MWIFAIASAVLTQENPIQLGHRTTVQTPPVRRAIHRAVAPLTSNQLEKFSIENKFGSHLTEGPLLFTGGTLAIANRGRMVVDMSENVVPNEDGTGTIGFDVRNSIGPHVEVIANHLQPNGQYLVVLNANFDFPITTYFLDYQGGSQETTGKSGDNHLAFLVTATAKGTLDTSLLFSTDKGTAYFSISSVQVQLLK